MGYLMSAIFAVSVSSFIWFMGSQTVALIAVVVLFSVCAMIVRDVQRVNAESA